MLFNVFAGIGSVSFIAARKGLCFAFVLKAVLLKTQGCFCYCRAAPAHSQGLFCSSHHREVDWGVHKGMRGRGHSKDRWPQGISHTLWCHTWHTKLGKKEAEGECSELWHLLSHVTITHDGVNEFLVLLCLCVVWLNFPTKLFLSSHNSSQFYPSNCPPCHCREGMCMGPGSSWGSIPAIWECNSKQVSAYLTRKRCSPTSKLL